MFCISRKFLVVVSNLLVFASLVPTYLLAQNKDGYANAMRRAEKAKGVGEEIKGWEDSYVFCSWDGGEVPEKWLSNKPKFVALCFRTEFLFYWMKVRGVEGILALVDVVQENEPEFRKSRLACEDIEIQMRQSRHGDPVAKVVRLSANGISVDYEKSRRYGRRVILKSDTMRHVKKMD